MFSDSDTYCDGFSSNWKISRNTEDNCSQTEKRLGVDRVVQAKNYIQTGAQTELQQIQTTPPAYNEDRLAAFLVKICPDVVEELDRVSRSNAFTSYAQVGDIEQNVREVCSVAVHDVEGVKISDVSWNCTGSVLAVALTHTLHSSWCSHQGHISLYNIDREKKSASCTLETSSCIRSVSMHPYLTSVVAAGTFSGEVVVWDTARQDSEIKLSNAGGTSHDDSVTQVCWVIGITTETILVSSALDGYIIFWKVSPQLASYQEVDRFRCGLLSGEPGITAFAFPHHNQDVFVVSVEGGDLLHCSTIGAKPLASVHSRKSVKDPVVKSFEPQLATVTCIEFSPHHEDVFATVATDQAIRIYSLYQRCAQRVIWCESSMVGITWSPAMANIVASWGDSTMLMFYDANSGDVVTTLATENAQQNSQLSCAAFNAKSPNLIAVGYLNGSVTVWEVLHVSTKPKNT